MKKTVVAPLAVLASAAVLTTFALGGTGKLGDVHVHADPVEYSVTFDENASCQEVAIDACAYYVFHTTTDNGNRVGVVGGPTVLKRITFKDVQFMMLALFDWNSALTSVGAYQFSTITGFKIDYIGGELTLSRNEYPRSIF